MSPSVSGRWLDLSFIGTGQAPLQAVFFFLGGLRNRTDGRRNRWKERGEGETEGETKTEGEKEKETDGEKERVVRGETEGETDGSRDRRMEGETEGRGLS